MLVKKKYKRGTIVVEAAVRPLLFSTVIKDFESWRLNKWHFHDGNIIIETSHGEKMCEAGDWIVKHPNGQFDVMPNAVFTSLYKPL